MESILGKIYVANSDSNTVSVINNKFTTTISVQNYPTKILQARNGTIYVLNTSSDSVSVIKKGTVINTLPVGKYPLDIIQAKNGKIYVAAGTAISVIKDNKIESTINVKGVRSPSIIQAKNGKIYVTTLDIGNPSALTITVIKDDKVINVITPDKLRDFAPYKLLETKGGDIYVSAWHRNFVAVIENDKITSKIFAGTNIGSSVSLSMLQTTDGGIYIANNVSNSISIIKNNKKIKTISVPSPVALMQALDGTIFVASKYSNSVSVIKDNNVIGTIPVGPRPVYITQAKDGLIYVANNWGNTISVFSYSDRAEHISGIVNYTRHPGKTYFFYDNGNYSRFDNINRKMDPGYPYSTAAQWNMSDIQAKTISAITKISTNPGKIYFFYKDGTFRRFDVNSDKMDPGYPLSTTLYWNM